MQPNSTTALNRPDEIPNDQRQPVERARDTRQHFSRLIG